MAEVLEEHFIDITVTNPDRIGTCVCGWVAGSMSISWDEHLEEVLTAAGFGPVKAAQAEALRDAAVPGKPAEPVPLKYCGVGVCVKLADRWEWAERYGEWLAVCHEHGDRIARAAAVEGDA
jgi:hypothetical protein